MEEKVEDSEIVGLLTRKDVFSFENLSSRRTKRGKFVVPEKYDTVDGNAFALSSFRKIVCKENVRSLKEDAFKNAEARKIDLSRSKIREIPDFTFRYSRASKIILHPSTEKIGEGAFLNCSSLKNLAIPPLVTTLSKDVFRGCDTLKQITLPESISQIEDGAFRECTGIVQLRLPKNIKTISANLFNGCSVLKRVEMSDDVVSIGNRAFAHCRELENFELPKSLREIGDHAFYNCAQLKSIVLPENVEKIEPDAFSFCSRLESIAFSDKIENIPRNFCKVCAKLEDVKFSDNITEIGVAAFQGCAIKKLDFPRKLTMIGQAAFSDNKMLEEVYIPDTVTELRSLAFSGCISLKKIRFSDSITQLFEQGHLGQVEEITLPRELVFISDKALAGNVQLKNVVFNDKVNFIMDKAFANTGIESVNLPNKNVISLGKQVFANCKHLKSADIETVLELKENLFENCDNLKSVKLSTRLKRVEKGVFKNCMSLTNLDFPETLEYVGNGAFENCSSLEKIIFKGVARFENSFSNLSEKTKFVSMPEGSQLFGSIAMPPLAYYTQKDGKIMLSATPVDASSFCIGDFVQEGNNQPQIEYVLALYDERENLLQLFKDCPFLVKTFNKILAKQGVEGVKDFYFENKDKFSYFRKFDNALMGEFFDENFVEDSDKIDEFYLKYKYSLKFLRQCASLVPKGCEEDFCRLYINLGGFEEKHTFVKKDKAGKEITRTVDYSQKVGELLKEMLISKPWFFTHEYLGGMQPAGFKREFSDFILQRENFEEVIEESEKSNDFFVNFYNDFEEAQKSNTSNKGSQRQLKPTIKSFKKYLFRGSFIGVNDENIDIANTIQPYFTYQSYFDDALAIDAERRNKQTPSHILKKPLKEQFRMIDTLSTEIKAEAARAVGNLVDATSEFTYEYLAKDDPRNFILGKLCDCCAHLGGAGYGIMHASIVHPDVQNLVIKNQRGEIVAKSTLYINRKQGYGVFNNVEVNEDVENREVLYRKYLQAVKDFALKYNEENPDMPPLKIITVGGGHNDLYKFFAGEGRWSKVEYKSINYSDYGKGYAAYNGDSEDEQFVAWEEEKT